MSHDPYAPVGKLLSSSRPPAAPPPPPAPEPIVVATDLTVIEDTDGIEATGVAIETSAAVVEAEQATTSPEDVIAEQLAALDALREAE